MQIVPLGPNVVIRREEAETTTTGGIVLPDSATNQPNRGKVLAVGDGYMLKDGSRCTVQVKEGDTVLFAPYAANEIQVDDDSLLIVPEAEILAIIE